MITLIIHILIAAILIALLLWVLSQIPVMSPYIRIVTMVVFVLFAIWIILQLLPLLGVH